MITRPQRLLPERLDRLPSDDPGAHASRRDLRVLNRLLGGERWLAKRVGQTLRPTERVLELGAGDGNLARAMLARGLPWDALDLKPAPRGWPVSAAWFEADALNFTPARDHAVVVANLFMHHFDADALGVLGKRLGRAARVVIVSDLVRSRLSLWAFAAICRVLRAHPITRHDGALSIRAGFRADELARALDLPSDEWSWRTWTTWGGAYRWVACRR